jgi:hypothetical protein
MLDASGNRDAQTKIQFEILKSASFVAGKQLDSHEVLQIPGRVDATFLTLTRIANQGKKIRSFPIRLPRCDRYVFSSEILHQGIIMKEMNCNEPAKQSAERARSFIQPIFAVESGLWSCRDGHSPVPLLCNVGVRLMAPTAGIVSYRLVVSSRRPQCGVPGGRIDAAVEGDVAWDPEGLGLDRPSVSFTVEEDCDRSTDSESPASRDRRFRGLPSVVAWFRPNGPCEPMPVVDAWGGEEAGFSFGLQVRTVAVGRVGHL